MDHSTVCQAALFTLRRVRSHDDIGLCYTTPQGIAPEGWLHTINHNYRMLKPFASEANTAHPHLEAELYETEVFDKDRIRVIFDWVETFRRETLMNRKYNRSDSL